MSPPTPAANGRVDPLIATLRDIRVERRLNQSALAAMAGCSQGAIGYMEKGTNSPTLNQLRKLTAALDLHLVLLPAHASCACCGCTDENRCTGGCHWVASGSGVDALCSRCARIIACEAIATGLVTPTQEGQQQ